MITMLLIKCKLCGQKAEIVVRDKTSPHAVARQAGWIECDRGWKCPCRNKDIDGVKSDK